MDSYFSAILHTNLLINPENTCEIDWLHKQSSAAALTSPWCCCLCGAEGSVPAGCWITPSSLGAAWNNTVTRPQPGGGSQAETPPVHCTRICEKQPPKGQRRHDSLWSFLSTSTSTRGARAQTAPNNHPPRALIRSEGVATVVFGAAAAATCCHFCSPEVTADNLFSTLITEQTGRAVFALADNNVSSSNHSLCSKSALRGEYAEQDALKSAEVKASKIKERFSPLLL